MSCGAVTGFIKTRQELEEYVKSHPGFFYEDETHLKPPFYVVSRVTQGDEGGRATEYAHHLFDATKARELLSLVPEPRQFHYGAISGVELQELTCYKDERGLLAELFRRDVIGHHHAPMMGYLSGTTQGVMRGPHEHVQQMDLFIFVKGQFELYLWDNRPASATYNCRFMYGMIATPNQMFSIAIPPGVVHAYKAINEDGLMLNFPDKLYKGWDKQQPVDEIRHEQDPNSPFQLWGN